MTESIRHAATAACLLFGVADLVFLNTVVLPRALRGGQVEPAAAMPVALLAIARPDPERAVPATPVAPPPPVVDPQPAPVAEPRPAPVPAAPSAVYFSTAASALDGASRAAIDELAGRLAQLLKKDRRATVVVYGHADARGDELFNDRLSQRRALAVSARLKARGVAPSKIVVRGFGSAQPASPGEDPASLRLNRRVEIMLRGEKS